MAQGGLLDHRDAVRATLHPQAAAADASISVLILTKDEEVSIGRCLASLHWSDDVVLLDSGSRDGTVEIARGFPNVRVVTRDFDDFASQRNFGLHQIVYRNEWLLLIDADELAEPALAAEMLDIARTSGRQPDVFMVRRKPVLAGQPLANNLCYRFWIARMVRPSRVRFEGIVHERLIFAGTPGRFRAALEHHQFSKGLDDWLARRISYARLEQQQRSPIALAQLKQILTRRDPLARRAAIKAVYLRLPLRWLIYLLVSLALTRPFCDGRAGLRLVWLEAYSQFYASRMLRRRNVAA